MAVSVIEPNCTCLLNLDLLTAFTAGKVTGGMGAVG